MKKYILLLIICIISIQLNAQIYDSTRRPLLNNATGYLYKIIGAQDGGVLLVPRNSPSMIGSRDSGAISLRNGLMQYWTGYQWVSLGVNGTGIISIDSSSRLIDGSVIIDSGMVGHSTALFYKILGRFYNSNYTPFTIAASSLTEDRYTIAYADTLGNFGLRDGTYGNYPNIAIPTIDDASEILLATYLIRANSTTPQGVSNIYVYRDGINHWANNRGTVTTGYDSAYATNSFSVPNSLRLTSQISGQYFEWQSPTTLSTSDYSFIDFYLRLSATFNNSTRWGIRLYNDTIPVTTTIIIQNGTSGYNRLISGSYQPIAIEMSGFKFISNTFNKIRITAIGNGSSAYQIDDVKLQKGGVNDNTSDITVNGIPGPNIELPLVDTGRLSSDSVYYELIHKRTGQILFKLETGWKYLSGDTCFVFDTVGRTITMSINPYCQGSGSGIQSVVAGSNVTVDNTDPLNPIVSSSGVGGSTDTTSLSNRINQKLNISDSALMLLTYRDKINEHTDTLAAHNLRIGANSTAIALKFNISDTTDKWVQSAYINGSGDSLIVFKNGVRSAYALPSGGSGEVNTASNVGSGSEIWKDKTGVDLRFRSILGASGVDVTQNTNDVTLKADTNLLATRWYAQNNLGYDTAKTGTSAQRLAITNLYPGYSFWQIDERIGQWNYNGHTWEHRPVNWITPQSATQQFFSGGTSGTGSFANYTQDNNVIDSARPMVIRLSTGTTTNGHGYIYGPNLNNAGSPPSDLTKSRYIFYARMKIFSAPTISEDYRVNIGWRTGSGVTQDSLSAYGAFFKINWHRGRDSVLATLNPNSGTSVENKVYPFTSIFNGQFHDYVIVFSNLRADYYIDGIYLTSQVIVSGSAIAQSNFFIGIFKTQGTTAVNATISNFYIYQSYVQ